MPRANRYIISGNVYHLTHRCHDREFLLKFAKDRSGYRERLRQAIGELDLSLLTYNITSNHVHLVAYADNSEQIAALMQQAAGEFAREYNRRKRRRGAFWEGRYHATMVDSGEYLWECLKYVELNMVRCGVVEHPGQWEWSGYAELMGGRKRNRLLDIEKLLWLVRATTMDEFRAHFNASLEEAIINDELKRQEKWAAAVAVGSRGFVEAIEQRKRTRQQMEAQQESGTWVLREENDSLFGGQNAPIAQS
ncbi:MAG: transposase [Verrucomicrobia bacterium]|nr:transposase [Verrucomicrobiota bacterium]